MKTSYALCAAALAVLAMSCKAPAPHASIDRALSSRVPSNTIALAGLDLDRLRVPPIWAKVPRGAREYLETFRDAHSLLIASTGAQFLTIAKGSVRGATQVTSDVALLGAPDLVAAASAPHAPPAILPAGEGVAARFPIWIAMRGGAPLPLEGNLANANNLVTLAETLTLTANVSDNLIFELTARCPTAGAAQSFEQRLRALISLSAAANARQPVAAATLRSVGLRREDLTVRATLSAPAESVELLLKP